MTTQQRAPFQLCMRKYERKVSWIGHAVPFTCQLPRGHEGDCSWAILAATDQLAESPPEPEVEAPVDDQQQIDPIMILLERIDSGAFDAYLENILAVAHERKRALRGRRTYPQLKRDQQSGLTPGGSCR